MTFRTADWARLEALIRELGALRALASRALGLGAEMKNDVETKIHEVAGAIDALIDHPDDDDKVLRAWEMVLKTRDFLEGLSHRARPKVREMMGALDIRQRAAEAMMRSMMLRKQDVPS